MNLRQLEYFLAIVDHGGVTKAAIAEHVAQPSLSHALRTLERDLGTELFHRIGRGMILSAAGKALVAPARQVQRDLVTARAAVAAVTDLVGGRLDIATRATLADHQLSTMVGRFRRSYPGVALTLTEPSGAASVDELVYSGDCELGLTYLPSDPELAVIELGILQFCAVLPPGSPGEDQVMPLASLRDVPLILGPPGTTLRSLVETSLLAVGVQPWIAIETSHRGAFLQMVLAGAGATMLPRAAAAEARAAGAVIRTLDPPLINRVGLVHRQGPLSPAAMAFKNIVAECLPTTLERIPGR